MSAEAANFCDGDMLEFQSSQVVEEYDFVHVCVYLFVCGVTSFDELLPHEESPTTIATATKTPTTTKQPIPQPLPPVGLGSSALTIGSDGSACGSWLFDSGTWNAFRLTQEY